MIIVVQSWPHNGHKTDHEVIVNVFMLYLLMSSIDTYLPVNEQVIMTIVLPVSGK